MKLKIELEEANRKIDQLTKELYFQKRKKKFLKAASLRKIISMEPLPKIDIKTEEVGVL